MSPNRHRRTPHLLSWSWVFFLLALLFSPLTASAVKLTGLSLTPPNPTLNISETLQLTATAGYDGGTQRVIAQAKQVSAGGKHSCALSPDGTVQCWGSNSYGQLGNGTNINSSIPVTVSGINNAVAISAGNENTCAVLSDGTLRCWGLNAYGQLGNGTTTDSLTPVTVSGINTAVSVSMPLGLSACALLSNATIRCWGLNAYGQLGNGTTTDSLTPVTVSGINTAVAVKTSGLHACALLADGRVQCWGENSYRQLGVDTISISEIPVTVSGISEAVDISLGFTFSCATLANGIIKCWGQNNYGQLGNGTYTANSSLTPATVSGISNAVSVSTNRYHACATLADGTIRCWGNNDSGQLGNGTRAISSIPVAVSEISSAVAVSAGDDHSCALLSDATLRCWGDNSAGQLTREPVIDSFTPMSVYVVNTDGSVAVMGDVAVVSAGASHTCTVQKNGSVYCWGQNRYGQLGVSSSWANYSEAVPVMNGQINKVAISSGYQHTCAVSTDGRVGCWGYGSFGVLGDNSITTAVALDAGSLHNCALLADGSVRCWGYNLYGQLGNGTNTNSSSPVIASGISSAVTISTGSAHSCAVSVDGTIKCWGNNGFGQLGNGTTENSSTPVTVSGISTAVAISAGAFSTCALLANGTVKCWGSNDRGQLGNGTSISSSTPVTVTGIMTAVEVDVGDYYACALLADGTLQCWGGNTYGQLGDGTTTDSLSPIRVNDIKNIASVSAGHHHVCVLLTDTTLKCWGQDNYGQLGRGAIYSINYTVPTPVLGYSPLAWTSSNPTVASVNSTGRVKALASGTSLITASVNGISASSLITVSPALTLDGFWPGTANPGQLVFIFGQGFVPNQTKVQVNGIPASFVQVGDPTLLFFMLPPGDTQGPITITTPNGTVTSTRNFNEPLTGVQITGLWPSIVSPGQLVFVFGAGFVTNATTATVNSIKAPVLQVLDPTLLFFMAPSTPTTGYVTVTTSAGTATSASTLTIK